MGVDIPHYRQQQENTCALVCLRMVLAAYGIQVTEREIEARTRLVERCVHIAELERLAHLYELEAEIWEATINDQRVRHRRDPGCAARPWALLCNAFGVPPIPPKTINGPRIAPSQRSE
jgi:hypothetical protein